VVTLGIGCSATVGLAFSHPDIADNNVKTITPSATKQFACESLIRINIKQSPSSYPFISWQTLVVATIGSHEGQRCISPQVPSVVNKPLEQNSGLSASLDRRTYVFPIAWEV
jgi:hypothetical protein